MTCDKLIFLCPQTSGGPASQLFARNAEDRGLASSANKLPGVQQAALPVVGATGTGSRRHTPMTTHANSLCFMMASLPSD